MKWKTFQTKTQYQKEVEKCLKEIKNNDGEESLEDHVIKEIMNLFSPNNIKMRRGPTMHDMPFGNHSPIYTLMLQSMWSNKKAIIDISFNSGYVAVRDAMNFNDEDKKKIQLCDPDCFRKLECIVNTILFPR